MTRAALIRRAIVAGAALALAAAGAGANSKVGTSGAPFLKLGAGARAAGMGQAFVAVGEDATAVGYNPAGLSMLSRPEIVAMRAQWIAGLDYDFGAFALPTDHGAVAISAATLKAQDLERRGLDESDQGRFDTLDAAYGLSFARNLSPRTSAGVTVRYVEQEIDATRGSAWSADLGAMHRLERLPVSVGLAVRNAGEKLKMRDQSDPLPMTIDAGAAATLWNERLLLTADVLKPRDNDVGFGMGGEWRLAMAERFRFAARAGFTTQGTDASGASGVSLGGRVGYRRFDLDMAWVPFGVLGNTFRYAATFRF